MNIKYIISMLAVILILTTMADAMPANPAPFTLTQPNGTTFQATHIGDERQSHFETLDGYTIVQDLDGYWVYAVTNETVLLPTQNKVDNANIKNLNITKHLAPKRVTYEETNDNTVNRIRGISYFPTTIGTTKAIVILIDFTDKQASPTYTPSFYNNLLFNTLSGANSLANYYKEVSYNQLNLIGDASPRWYTSSHTMSYYGEDYTTGGDDANTLIVNLAEEAISLADNDIDFSQYDGDGDGIVDHVIIIHAGDDQSSSHVSTDIWSHQWILSMPVDGVQINSYTMLAESSPLGTFAHEFAHDIGLPDLYNTEDGSGVVEYWDLMDGGGLNNNGDTPGHLSAWSKIQLGWITPITVTTQTAVNIPQLETNQYNSVYKISSSNMPYTEYFLVENRQKTGYDSYLPDDGIVIWHIDESQGSFNYNDVNNGIIKRVAVEDASNGLSDWLMGAAYSSNDFQTTFSPTSSPNSNSNAGILTDISIYNIGSSGSSMNVSFLKSTLPILSVSASQYNVSIGVPTYIGFAVTPAISGVTIILSGTGVSASGTTDSSGTVVFLIDPPNIGTIIATASKTGYTSDSTSIAVTNPSTTDNINLVLAGSYDTTGYASDVTISGNYAYVADWDNGLVIVDISNSAAPMLAGSYDTVGAASDVAVSGNYAYVADWDNGLVVIDISNPTSPTLVWSHDTAGWAKSVTISGSYVYVSDDVDGVVIFDISNPATPSLVGYNTEGYEWYAWGIAISGSYAYIADGTYGLSIIDISNPTTPVFVVDHNTGGYARGIAISDSYAYVADWDNGLVIFDISNPETPMFVVGYDTEGYARGIAISGNYAYVVDDDNGLVIFDISNPEAPMLVGSYDTAGFAIGVAVSGSYAYVADDDNGLVILSTDVSSIDTTQPILTISSPADGAILTTPALTISGIASDDVAVASVTVNGNLATGTTSWSADITLTEGTNTITAVAIDTSGNTATDTITITYTPSADTLTGDVNGDGILSSVDALMALQMSAGNIAEDLAADVSGDGSVTSLDALMILQASVGAIVL